MVHRRSGNRPWWAGVGTLIAGRVRHRNRCWCGSLRWEGEGAHPTQPDPLKNVCARETIHKRGNYELTIGATPIAQYEEQSTMDWRHRAICRDEDPELFFPVGTSGPALLQIAEARTVCRRCPVVTECLTWALESGQDAGVWGGMSEDERRALKRRNARTRARSA